MQTVFINDEINEKKNKENKEYFIWEFNGFKNM